MSINILPGSRIYKYEMRQQIGTGRSGQVWIAHDNAIDKDVAVKLIDSTQATISQHLKEAQIGNRLNHPNVVKVHYADVVTHNENNFVIIAMDHIKNGSIVNKLNANNYLPIPDTIKHVIEVLKGLEYLHEQNLFHGDIKPQNILISDDSQAVLTDYGISCTAPKGAKATPLSFYKPHASPEILAGAGIDARTDVYQTGLTAFRLFNGIGTLGDRFSILGDTKYYDLIKSGKLISEEFYLRFVTRNIKHILKKAISVNQSDRYQTALEMRRAFEKLLLPGYWTVNSLGQEIGINGEYKFSFQITPISYGKVNFDAIKEYSSGRKHRISKFSQVRMSQKKAITCQKKFMQAVVGHNPTTI